MSNFTSKLKYILTNIYLIANFAAFIAFSTWSFLIYFNYIDNRFASDSLYTRSNLIQFGINFAFIGICIWNLLRYMIGSFRNNQMGQTTDGNIPVQNIKFPSKKDSNIREVTPVIAEVVELPQRVEK